jgi:FMN phosphatase YigB (HAD superfamily)
VSGYRAVLFDAFGTLIELDRPAARLQGAVRMHLGSEISHEQAAEAMRAELTHYAAHCRTARDQPSLLHLQRACAAGIDVVILDRSPAPAAGTISSLLELEPLLA